MNVLEQQQQQSMSNTHRFFNVYTIIVGPETNDGVSKKNCLV